jgi:hypothetical protein
MKTLPFRKIFSKIYVNTNYDPKNTILIAGTGRSGTTWIAKLINHDNEYRDMFEPFAPQYTKEWRKYKYKQYIGIEDQREEIADAAKKILSGKVRNNWVDQYNRKFFCKKRIIKEIRGNFLLKWINHQFSEIPIVFVMRHPCAVALSRIRLGWDQHFNSIITQKNLVNDFFTDSIGKIKDLKTEFEKQIFLWCLENYVPLRQISKKEMYIAHYEHFCSNPEKEIRRLFEWLKIDYTKRFMDAVKSPSAVTERHSAIMTGGDLIDSWRKDVSECEINQAVKILKIFGLNEVYNQSSLPRSTSGFSVYSFN